MPDYEITSPDGKRYRVTAPDGATQEQVLAYAQQQFGQQTPAAPAAPPSTAAPPATPPPAADQPTTWGQAISNVGQAGLSLASGALATPVAGLAGLASSPFVGADRAAKITDSVSGAMTFRPRTAGAQGVVEGVTYPLRKLAEGAQALAAPIANGSDGQPRFRGPMQAPAMAQWEAAGKPRAEGSPLLATALDTALQSAPALLMRGRQKTPATVAQAPVPKPAPVVAPRQALIEELNAKGLKITPTQAGAKVGSVVEGMAGPAKLERSLSLKNSPRINELVAEDVGLKGVKNITEGDLNRLKVEANKPYKEISQTGIRKLSNDYRNEIAGITDRTGGDSFKGMVQKDIKALKRQYSKIEQFTAQDAVNQIRELRSQASKNIKAINAPEQNAKGYAQKAIAEALDNELARHVADIGKPELAAKYKAARVQLAKIHTLEDALEGSNISPRALAAAKDRGAPLNGNMDLVARAYTEFDRSFQDVGKIRDSGPFGAVDVGAGVVGATANPALLAAVVARPLTRAALASDRYQRGLAKPGKAKAPTAPPSSNALAKPAAVNSLATDERRRRAQ